MLGKFTYMRAGSLQEAVEAASIPGARVLAGGTDLLGCLRDHVFTARSVVSISGLRDLQGIVPRPGGGLRIGALTTLTEIARNPQVRESYQVLAEAATGVASPQLRNQGTLGGNLCQRPRCWYFRGDFHCRRKGGDTCFAEAGENQLHAILGWDRCLMVHPSDTASALTALGAKLTIEGRDGRRTIPIESFFVSPNVSLLRENVLEPGQLVTEILLDPPRVGTRSTYRKVRDRGAFDFALAGAAIVLRLAQGKVQNVRIVLSGVAPMPWRSADAEQALIGRPLDAATVAASAAAAVKDAVAIGKNDYKIALARGVVEETLLRLAHA